MRFTFTILSILTTLCVAQDYVPASSEQEVLNNRNFNSSSGCLIWKENSPLRDSLIQWKDELNHYALKMKEKKDFAPDVRLLFSEDHSNKEQVCREHADPPADSLDARTALRGRSLAESGVNGNLMEEYFSGSHQLSYLPKQGYMEPLVPPLRHPDMCQPDLPLGAYMGTMDYLIEDFGHICRNTLKKSSRTVFIDMGATYNFNSDEIDMFSPAIRAIEKYRRAGIHFDHIYAYEIMQWDTERVYKTIPKHMQGPLHWINTGVVGEEGHPHNPFTMLLENFDADDFVVVKLDIDTPAVEFPLFEQLQRDPKLQEIVDVFYFEHHVQMDEMQPFWGAHESGATHGTIIESLELFHKLRQNGVAAHYWI